MFLPDFLGDAVAAFGETSPAPQNYSTLKSFDEKSLQPFRLLECISR